MRTRGKHQQTTSKGVRIQAGPMNWWSRASVMVPAGVVASCFSFSAYAVTFGPIQVQSALGHRFQSLIAVTGNDKGSLEQNCLKAYLAAMDGGFLDNVNIQVSADQSALLIRSVHSINEPAVTLTLQSLCNGQIEREYRVLLDPIDAGIGAPVSALASVHNENSEPAASASVAQRPSPIASLSPIAPIARIKTERAPKTAVVANRETQQHQAVASTARVDEPGYTGLRLTTTLDVSRLRTASTTGTTGTTGGAITTIGAEPVASATLASDSVDAHQVMELQRMVQQLRAETQALRASISQRDVASSPAVPATASKLNIAPNSGSLFEEPGHWLQNIALVACGFIIASLAWALRRTQKRHADLQREMLEPESGQELVDPFAATQEYAKVDDTPVFESATPSVKLEVNAEPAAPRTNNATTDNFDADHWSTPIRQASAQSQLEVCDEVQQAEFWMRLDQPQRAIEILEAQWAQATPDTPLPWIYLLEAYRAAGTRVPYEALRDRFHQVFNGIVPPWELPVEEPAPKNDDKILHLHNHIAQRSAAK